MWRTRIANTPVPVPIPPVPIPLVRIPLVRIPLDPIPPVPLPALIAPMRFGMYTLPTDRSPASNLLRARTAAVDCVWPWFVCAGRASLLPGASGAGAAAAFNRIRSMATWRAVPHDADASLPESPARYELTTTRLRRLRRRFVPAACDAHAVGSATTRAAGARHAHATISAPRRKR